MEIKYIDFHDTGTFFLDMHVFKTAELYTFLKLKKNNLIFDLFS